MNIVIVEDEPASARLLEKMLEKIDSLNIAKIKIYSSIDEAKSGLAGKVDILFLDLNLMGRSGFEILEEFASEPFDTIVTTAYPGYALRAFELGVRDYMVKPFSQERLQKALARVPTVQEKKTPAISTIVVKEKGKITPISVKGIVLVRSADDYAELYCDDGSKRLCSKRMDFLEKRLPNDFMRIHRSAIVRLSKVKNLLVRTGGKYCVDIEGVEEPAPVGRKYYKTIRDRL